MLHIIVNYNNSKKVKYFFLIYEQFFLNIWGFKGIK